jgi:hypothetical protein
MLMTHFSLKKIVAAILPFCFLWLFAACVSSCGDDSTETRQHHSALSETADASNSDSCSIVNVPAAIASERTAFDFEISPVVLHPTFPAKVLSFVAAKISRHDGKPPFRDSPLKLLPVLRI